MHSSRKCFGVLPLSLSLALCSAISGSFGNVSSAQAQPAPSRTSDAPLQLAANRVDGASPGQNSAEDENANQQQPAGLEHFHKLLQEARTATSQVDRYKATLEKQVRLNGELCDPETIDIKVRHRPFAVYMKWQSDGKEALYAEGENNGKLVARPTRGLAALKGVWELQPDAPKAMVGCRYPVTEIGLEKMIERVCAYYFEEYQNEIASCDVHQEERDGRQVHIVELTFPSKDESQYSICKYYFDAESKLLYGLELCEWNYEGEPAGIAEKFVYRDIDAEQIPDDNEFRVDHPKYSLVSKR